jgi:hypothetical protein
MSISPLGGSYVSATPADRTHADRTPGTYTGTAIGRRLGTFVSTDAVAAPAPRRYTDSQFPAMTTATGTVRTATGTIRTATGSFRVHAA